jgi:hypothetical protein
MSRETDEQKKSLVGVQDKSYGTLEGFFKELFAALGAP